MGADARRAVLLEAARAQCLSCREGRVLVHTGGTYYHRWNSRKCYAAAIHRLLASEKEPSDA